MLRHNFSMIVLFAKMSLQTDILSTADTFNYLGIILAGKQRGVPFSRRGKGGAPSTAERASMSRPRGQMLAICL